MSEWIPRYYPIFVRLGDAGSYEQVEDLHELISLLQENAVSGPLEYCNQFGVQAPGYVGNDYISLYYGDGVELPIRGLHQNELDEINRKLKQNV